MSAIDRTKRATKSLLMKAAYVARPKTLRATRVLLDLVENGIESERRKEQEFFDLARRFRSVRDPHDAKRLGDQLGRLVFGGSMPKGLEIKNFGSLGY